VDNPKTEVLLLARKNFSEKACSKRPSLVSVHQPLCYLLPTSSTFSALKTPENTEEDPDDHEPVDE